MNRYFPLSMLALLACGGDGGGIIQPIPNPHDISSLAPGEYRVLRPADIPNGIDLPSVPEAREFVIIVGNSSNAGDIEAIYLVRGNLAAPASASADQRVEISQQRLADVAALDRIEGPQRSLERRLRGFERKSLSFRRISAPATAGASTIRPSTQVAT